MSIKTLIKLTDEKKNPSVVGLDPMLEYVPKEIISRVTREYGKTLTAAGEALYEYNREIIDSVADIVACVKPQSAFYELYGLEGEKALAKTIEYAKKCGLYVILDVKRGDIGSTAAAYSAAYLGMTSVFGEEVSVCGCDAVTVNPYLGTDGITPFTDDCRKYGKMIFTLVKTSNKSSGELQDVVINGSDEETLYLRAARLNAKWGEGTEEYMGYNSVGAVVGATYPAQLELVRKEIPHTMLLIPGYGAQGGKGEDIACAFDAEGRGAVVNSSRGIILAHKKLSGDPKCAWRDAALRMRDDITGHIRKR